jgi:hypothetical protein
MDPASIRAELARLCAGTRVRLFHREGAERRATSGKLLSVGTSSVTIAPDAGGVLEVPVSTLTCFYVPKPFAGSAAPFAALRRELGRLAPPRSAPLHLPGLPEAER